MYDQNSYGINEIFPVYLPANGIGSVVVYFDGSVLLGIPLRECGLTV